MSKCKYCNKYIYFGDICLKCLFTKPIYKKCLVLNKFNNKYNISNEKKNM